MCLSNSTYVIVNYFFPHCLTFGTVLGKYRVFVKRPEGKSPPGRSTRKWEDNIKTGLQEVGRGGMEWVNLAQERDMWPTVTNEVMNFRVL
jgi:hypothetical protein